MPFDDTATPRVAGAHRRDTPTPPRGGGPEFRGERGDDPTRDLRVIGHPSAPVA